MLAMQTFLQAHPNIASEIETLKEMVCLVPDESIVFMPKRSLLKPTRLAMVWMNQQLLMPLGSAAALLVLLLAAYILGYSDARETTSPIAQTPIEHVDTTTTEAQYSQEIVVNIPAVSIIQDQNNNIKNIKRQSTKNELYYNSKEIEKSGIATLPTNTTSLLENKESDKIIITETIILASTEMVTAELPKKKLSLISTEQNQATHEQRQAIALHDNKKNQSL